MSSLDSFVKEVQADIIKFEKSYSEKHAENPENYPLELSADNSGLWFEFFVDFCNNGIV